MLVNPRLYSQYTRAQDAQIASFSAQSSSGHSAGASVVYWSSLPPKIERHVKKMLLIHQSGSVRVGEVVRYTVTYTPARDRVRPVPKNLHVRIRNTCAIALRAAYLHGPYTLYTACYPTTFNPNAKHDAEKYGEPQFEPMLKAGGSWTATLKVPEDLRKACEEPSSSGDAPESCSWIIECTSQVLFSVGATVHYEVIVGRDEKSVETGFAGLTGTINSTPGRLIDHQQQSRKPGEHVGLMKGVFSNAITVEVEDTACLWNKPTLPGLEHAGFHAYDPSKGIKSENPTDSETKGNKPAADASRKDTKNEPPKKKKKRKVHLVVITHGLHSNLGADMLYMKESIDAAAKQARKDARARHKAELSKINSNPIHDYTSSSPPPPEAGKAKEEATSTAPLSGGQEDLDDEPEEDEEEVIVRGFSGNAIRTERGIQYLGKRLAKYVLGMTYPDQPFLPIKKTLKKTLSRAFSSKDKTDGKGHESHHHSSIMEGGSNLPHVDRPYQITSISFIGHSLGGLTQTYAVAYIQKHSPEFFQRIQPVNFIALASPFLGLSNENPLYVKFALDFGLVGRTGQDLGLTWRAPTLARSGWAGVIAGIGNDKQRAPKKVDPGTKPLLRLLPAGPAHTALKLFRNRTVYSNVVNDGIVPLRTSCLLFLDWRGLGRVEKARRENGLIGTMAGWGWAELTGTNQTEHRSQWPWSNKENGSAAATDDDDSDDTPLGEDGDQVPQPADDETRADNATTRANMSSKKKESDSNSQRALSSSRAPAKSGNGQDEPKSPLAGFMSFFSGGNKKEKQQYHDAGPKSSKMMRRAQTLKLGSDEDQSSASSSPEPSNPRQGPREGTTIGDSENVFAPPKTSVFEAAGDLINPPLPAPEFILDPQKRPRTIFHDKVYHPEDIPAPPVKRRPTFMRKKSSQVGASRKPSDDTQMSPPNSPSNQAGLEPGQETEVGSMQVEEKIARAYHRDLSWRKVLVRLEPDAHNNIVVRRMFANAYGWPVVKHLVDTHFADTKAALTADRKEDNTERARPMTEPATEEGDEVRGQRRRMSGEEDDERDLMYREAHDELQELKDTHHAVGSLSSSTSVPKSLQRQDSVASSASWTDRFFDGTDDDDSDDDAGDQALEGYSHWQKKKDETDAGASTPKGTSQEVVDDFLFGKGVGEGVSKGKARDEEERPASGGKPLVLPVENVVQSPTSLTPKVGLGKSVEDKLKLDETQPRT